MVYILFGEDEARSRYKLETLKKTNPHDTFERYDLNETSQEVILDAMDSFSLFDDKTMIVVDNASFLAAEPRKKAAGKTAAKPAKKRGKGAKKEKVLSARELQMEAFAKRNPEDKTIVYMVPAKTLIKNVRDVFPSAIVMESKALDEKSQPGVIEEMIRERHLTMEPDALRYFQAHAGLNTLKISSELDKLALFSDHLRLEDVKALMVVEPEDNVFAMTEALFEQRILDLLGLYRSFRAQNMEPVAINGLLASQIRFVFQVRVLMDLRYSQQEIADQLKTSSGRIYYTMKKARRFTAAKLLEYLDLLAELDWNMKSGKVDKDDGFEDFFLRMLQEKQTPRGAPVRRRF